jgi:hypothetical protein
VLKADSAWHTKAEYEKQIDTEAHRLLHAKLTALSTSVPTTSLLYFDRESYGRRTLPLQKSWPGVTLAYFKDRVSEEQRAIMSKVRGFHPWIYSPGDSPTRGEHARGLLFPNHDVTMPSSGGPAGAYIFIDHWESPIREVEIRGPDQVALSQGRYISLSENFEKELKDAGCDERVVRHVRFNKILGVNYREPPVKGESIDYDWEEGKRDRAFELRWMADRDANGDTQHSLRTM